VKGPDVKSERLSKGSGSHTENLILKEEGEGKSLRGKKNQKKKKNNNFSGPKGGDEEKKSWSIRLAKGKKESEATGLTQGCNA